MAITVVYAEDVVQSVGNSGCTDCTLLITTITATTIQRNSVAAAAVLFDAAIRSACMVQTAERGGVCVCAKAKTTREKEQEWVRITEGREKERGNRRIGRDNTLRERL